MVEIMGPESAWPATIWVMAAVAVLLASALQAATGAGLGLIAGPVLLLAMQSSGAIHVAVILNLALSLALLPSERHELPDGTLTWLSAGAILGLPLGAFALSLAPLSALELAAGFAVTLGGVQLLLAIRRPRRAGATSDSPLGLGGFGLLSGMMTAALAIPGPAALWGLGRTSLTTPEIRAVLRAFFVIAYTLTLGILATLGMNWGVVLEVTAWMLPALVVGGAAGVYIKTRIGELALRKAFIVLLIAMGITLLLNSGSRLFG